MRIYEAGRESSLLDDILIGDKTIEGRLNKGKFASYQVGDFVWLRRDIYRDGRVHEVPRQVLVAITKIDHFTSFRNMLEVLGFKSIIPRAKSIEAALAEYAKYYTLAEEVEYGVIAVHVRLATPDELESQT